MALVKVYSSGIFSGNGPTDCKQVLDWTKRMLREDN
ncbi:hypothetical protein EYZ11_012078 [Aspergillus tanneri]|uniref:Uncharacterized protein n=1 Tax=Aspergillus tanneri TaxID=1220188 RepID=A0A4S3J178_9EURO|nr:hypothetical protein EYZ11_012078 [Aspergillus tanneri]